MFNKEYPYKSSESRTMRSAFKKFSSIKEHDRILEIGSGSGRLSECILYSSISTYGSLYPI